MKLDSIGDNRNNRVPSREQEIPNTEKEVGGSNDRNTIINSTQPVKFNIDDLLNRSSEESTEQAKAAYEPDNENIRKDGYLKYPSLYDYKFLNKKTSENYLKLFSLYNDKNYNDTDIEKNGGFLSEYGSKDLLSKKASEVIFNDSNLSLPPSEIYRKIQDSNKDISISDISHYFEEKVKQVLLNDYEKNRQEGLDHEQSLLKTEETVLKKQTDLFHNNTMHPYFLTKSLEEFKKDLNNVSSKSKEEVEKIYKEISDYHEEVRNLNSMDRAEKVLIDAYTMSESLVGQAQSALSGSNEHKMDYKTLAYTSLVEQGFNVRLDDAGNLKVETSENNFEDVDLSFMTTLINTEHYAKTFAILSGILGIPAGAPAAVALSSAGAGLGRAVDLQIASHNFSFSSGITPSAVAETMKNHSETANNIIENFPNIRDKIELLQEEEQKDVSNSLINYQLYKIYKDNEVMDMGDTVNSSVNYVLEDLAFAGVLGTAKKLTKPLFKFASWSVKDFIPSFFGSTYFKNIHRLFESSTSVDNFVGKLKKSVDDSLITPESLGDYKPDIKDAVNSFFTGKKQNAKFSKKEILGLFSKKEGQVFRADLNKRERQLLKRFMLSSKQFADLVVENKAVAAHSKQSEVLISKAAEVSGKMLKDINKTFYDLGIKTVKAGSKSEEENVVRSGLNLVNYVGQIRTQLGSDIDLSQKLIIKNFNDMDAKYPQLQRRKGIGFTQNKINNKGESVVYEDYVTMQSPFSVIQLDRKFINSIIKPNEQIMKSGVNFMSEIEKKSRDRIIDSVSDQKSINAVLDSGNLLVDIEDFLNLKNYMKKNNWVISGEFRELFRENLENTLKPVGKSLGSKGDVIKSLGTWKELQGNVDNYLSSINKYREIEDVISTSESGVINLVEMAKSGYIKNNELVQFMDSLEGFTGSGLTPTFKALQTYITDFEGKRILETAYLRSKFNNIVLNSSSTGNKSIKTLKDVENHIEDIISGGRFDTLNKNIKLAVNQLENKDFVTGQGKAIKNFFEQSMNSLDSLSRLQNITYRETSAETRVRENLSTQVLGFLKRIAVTETLVGVLNFFTVPLTPVLASTPFFKSINTSGIVRSGLTHQINKRMLQEGRRLTSKLGENRTSDILKGVLEKKNLSMKDITKVVLDISKETGKSESYYVRPANDVNKKGNYFIPIGSSTSKNPYTAYNSKFEGELTLKTWEVMSGLTLIKKLKHDKQLKESVNKLYKKNEQFSSFINNLDDLTENLDSFGKGEDWKEIFRVINRETSAVAIDFGNKGVYNFRSLIPPEKIKEVKKAKKAKKN